MTSPPAAPREPSREAFAAKMELARARSLAAAAGSIVHELNNQFNAVLGLAAQLRPFVRDERELALLDDLQAGTRIGARMLAVLTRMLGSDADERAVVDAAALLEDALVVVRKSMVTEGIDLRVSLPAGLPAVRTVATAATQAVLQGLLAVIACRPAAIRVEVDAVVHAIADGRERPCVRLRCAAQQLDADSVTQLAAVGNGGPGLLQRVAEAPESLEGLAGSRLIQRRLGGDLRVEPTSDGLRLDYWWPATVPDGPPA